MSTNSLDEAVRNLNIAITEKETELNKLRHARDLLRVDHLPTSKHKRKAAERIRAHVTRSIRKAKKKGTHAKVADGVSPVAVALEVIGSGNTLGKKRLALLLKRRGIGLNQVIGPGIRYGHLKRSEDGESYTAVAH